MSEPDNDTDNQGLSSQPGHCRACIKVLAHCFEPLCVFMLLCRPPQLASGIEAAVQTVILHPLNPEHVIVCNKSSTAYIMTMQVNRT